MSPEHHAKELLAAYDGASRLALRTAADVGFDLPRAYEVADLIRQQRIARGERPLGYKIGFTNRDHLVAIRRVWPDLGCCLGHDNSLA